MVLVPNIWTAHHVQKRFAEPMIFNMSTSRVSVGRIVHLLSFISHLQPRCYLHDSLTFDKTFHVAASRE